jgi:hypothetical protein
MNQKKSGQKTKSVKSTAHVGTFLDALAGSVKLSWRAAPVGATIAFADFAMSNGAPQLGHANALQLIL